MCQYIILMFCIIEHHGFGMHQHPDLTLGGAAEARALSPFIRMGEPQDVADVVSVSASDAASWVHGQIGQPNGGMN